MNAYFLHMTSPGRDGDAAVIAGDDQALLRLRAAIDVALAGGAGAARFYSSDGESYGMVLVREQDMGNACTTYRNEAAPQRSLRETRQLDQLEYFTQALCMLRHLGS